MKVTVCELNDSVDGFARDWERLVAHVQEHRSDLVLLPEMPFCPWFAWRPDFEMSIWQDAVAAHDKWQERLAELEPAIVLATRPANLRALRVEVDVKLALGEFTIEQAADHLQS